MIGNTLRFLKIYITTYHQWTHTLSKSIAYSMKRWGKNRNDSGHVDTIRHLTPHPSIACQEAYMVPVPQLYSKVSVQRMAEMHKESIKMSPLMIFVSESIDHFMTQEIRSRFLVKVRASAWPCRIAFNALIYIQPKGAPAYETGNARPTLLKYSRV